MLCSGIGECKYCTRGFLEGGNVGPTLEFRRHIAKEMLENTIGMEPIYEGMPWRTFTISEVVPYELVTALVFSGRWLVELKNSKE